MLTGGWWGFGAYPTFTRPMLMTLQYKNTNLCDRLSRLREKEKKPYFLGQRRVGQ